MLCSTKLSSDMPKIIEKYSHYFSSISYLTLSQIVSAVFGLTSTVILIRYLTPTEYGLFVLALSLEGRFGVIALPGMNFILQKALIKGRNDYYKVVQNKVLKYSISIGFLIVLVALLNMYVVDNYIAMLEFLGDFKWELLIVAVFIIIPKSANKYEILVMCNENYRVLLFYKLLQSSIYFLLVALTAYFFENLYYVLFGVILHSLILLIYTNIKINNTIQLDLVNTNNKERDENIKDGLKYTAINLNAFIFRFERVVLGTVSPELLGLYHIAEKIPTLTKDVLKNFLTPVLIKQGKRNGCSNYSWIRGNLLKLLVVGLISFLLSCLIIYLLFPVFFTENYLDGKYYSYLISIPMVLLFVNAALTSYDTVQNSGLTYRKYYFFHPIIFGIIAYLTIPSIGIMGLIYAMFGTMLLHLFCSIEIYYRAKKITDF